MAIATSLLHRSFKGAVGDLIFRTYNGKTIVSARPVYKNETNTEARRQARGRFRDATGFASYAMEVKKLKVYYTQKARQLKLPNAYTAAITDYLRKAKVVVARPSSFAARRGEVLNIRITKSVFSVDKVKAQLYDKEGILLSEQTLVRSGSQKMFDFKFTDDFPGYSMMKIITDEPLSTTYTIDATVFIVMPLINSDWRKS